MLAGDIYGIPLLPLIALIGGIITLIKADFLNWVVAIFLIGFGLLNILPVLGVDVSSVTQIVDGAGSLNGGSE